MLHIIDFLKYINIILYSHDIRHNTDNIIDHSNNNNLRYIQLRLH